MGMVYLTQQIALVPLELKDRKVQQDRKDRQVQMESQVLQVQMV